MNYDEWLKKGEGNLNDLFKEFRDTTCDSLGKNVKFSHFKTAMREFTIDYYDKAYDTYRNETIKRYK